MSDVRLGTRPHYSVVIDEDVKKPTNKPSKQTNRAGIIMVSFLRRFTAEMNHEYGGLPFDVRSWQEFEFSGDVI